MTTHKVSKEHAAELKAMSIRANEIAKEDGVASINITGYSFGGDTPYTDIHAHKGVTVDDARTFMSGDTLFSGWHRDGIKYVSQVVDDNS